MWFVRWAIGYGISNAAQAFGKKDATTALTLYAQHVNRNIFNCPPSSSILLAYIKGIKAYAVMSLFMQTVVVLATTTLMTLVSMLFLNAWYLTKTGWGWLFG